MTQDRLRDLLHDRVADESMPDYAAQAWRRAHVVRRRHRLGAVAGVVAATVAVSSGIALVDSTPSKPPRDRGLSDPASSAPAAAPDATYRSYPVWFSPSPTEERQLPEVDGGPLPREIDLGAAPPLDTDPMGSANAAFAVFDESRLDRVVLLGADGYRSLDLTRLEEVTKANGYRLWPVGESMLSPGGRYLLFPQDGFVWVVTLADASWQRVDVDFGSYGSHWIDDHTFFVPDFYEDSSTHGGGLVFDLDTQRGHQGSDVLSPTSPVAGQAQRYGAWVSSFDGPLTAHHLAGYEPRIAQSYGMGSGLPARDSDDMAQPESVWVADPGADAGGEALSITWPVSGGGRSKDCCPVAGWLDDRTLVYESRATDPVLVAWTVGTGEFRLVSRIGGLDDQHESYVASFAL